MSGNVTETIRISASAQRLYAMVSDVSRVGLWSPEATGARRAAANLDVGDTFIGMNRRGPVMWWTYCSVLRAEPGSVFEFDVDFGPLPVSRWTYEFAEQPDGSTDVTETWVDRRTGVLGIPIRTVGQLVIPGDRDAHNTANIRVSLKGLKARAEDESAE